MAGLWTDIISSKVFSTVYIRFPNEISYNINNTVTKAQISFSSSTVSESIARFPYVTIVEMPGQERGQTLDGTDINAAYFSFQIDVFDNESEPKAKAIMSEIIKIIKSMRFNIDSMPSFESQAQNYRMVARVSRIIGQSDKL